MVYTEEATIKDPGPYRMILQYNVCSDVMRRYKVAIVLCKTAQSIHAQHDILVLRGCAVPQLAFHRLFTNKMPRL